MGPRTEPVPGSTGEMSATSSGPARDTSSKGLVRRLLLAKALRSFADGFVSLLLPLHLLQP